MVRSCIIGFGGIAQGHRAAYANLEKQGIAKLVGVYDIDPEQFTRKITINIDTGEQEKLDIHFYTDLEEMLEKEKPDMIDICVPSFLHADYAVQMLERGYHVQCEKPMALNYADCKRMLAAAEKSGKELMIGQILHFFWEYDYLKNAVDDGRFGKVLAASFSRLSSPPRWAWENWFMDYERSGGAMTDLHIHDVDMVRYLFGEPKAVSCQAQSFLSGNDTCFTNFYYESKMPVHATGDWNLWGVEFKAGFRVTFEKAVLVMDGSGLTVYPADYSEPWKPENHDPIGFDAEIGYFAGVIEGKYKNTKNPAWSAAKSIKLVEAMRKSAAEGGVVVPFEAED